MWALSDLALCTRHEDNSQNWKFSLKSSPASCHLVYDSILHFLLQQTTSEGQVEARLGFLKQLINFTFYTFLLFNLPVPTTWKSDAEKIPKL